MRRERNGKIKKTAENSESILVSLVFWNEDDYFMRICKRFMPTLIKKKKIK